MAQSRAEQDELHRAIVGGADATATARAFELLLEPLNGRRPRRAERTANRVDLGSRIHPVAWGSGLPMFRDLPESLRLKLLESVGLSRHAQRR